MKAKRQKCDNATIEFATYRSSRTIKHTIATADKFRSDPDKEKRLKENECPACFYVKSRIGGAAMTEAECSICGKPHVFPSTNVDVLCDSCAGEHKLCRHCGGDIDAKQRRKKRF